MQQPIGPPGIAPEPLLAQATISSEPTEQTTGQAVFDGSDRAGRLSTLKELKQRRESPNSTANLARRNSLPERGSLPDIDFPIAHAKLPTLGSPSELPKREPAQLSKLDSPISPLEEQEVFQRMASTPDTNIDVYSAPQENDTPKVFAHKIERAGSGARVLDDPPPLTVQVSKEKASEVVEITEMPPSPPSGILRNGSWKKMVWASPLGGPRNVSERGIGSWRERAGFVGSARSMPHAPSPTISSPHKKQLRRLSLVESGTVAVEGAVKAGRRMSAAFVNAARALVRAGSSKRMLVPRTRHGREAGRAVGNEVQAFLMMAGGAGDSINREQYRTLLDYELKRLKLGALTPSTREAITNAVFREKNVLDMEDFDKLLQEVKLPVGNLMRGQPEVHFLSRSLSDTGMSDEGEGDVPVHKAKRKSKWMKALVKYFKLKSYWDDNGRQFSLTVYALVNVVLVFYVIASRNGWFPGSEAKQVGGHGGWWINAARAFGVLCNFNCSFVIVPMMRTYVTWLQNSWLAEYIPFDKAYDFHQLVGALAFIFGTLHGLAHVINLIVWDGWSLQGNLWCGPEPDGFLFCSAISGVFAMIVFSVIVFFSLPRLRKTSHNVFWTTHHLVLLLYVILLLHGHEFWKWFLGPCLFYVADRINRHRNASFNAQVVSTSHKDDGVLQIVFTKPWNLVYLPGQYVYLTAPAISKFEQHPFTLSSCPEDDTLECHIKSVGDWTEAAYHAYDPADVQDGKPAFTHPDMNINVAGPYGAPSQDWALYETVVLICAGIGVTPFASVIKHIHQRHRQRTALRNAGLKIPQYLDLRVKKLYFYWICRTQESFRWFTDVIRAAQEDMGDALNVNVYLSSMTPLGDVSAGMTHLGLHSYYHLNKRDALTQLPVLTHYHRPDWHTIFKKLSTDHPAQKVGVFFCGPHSLSTTLSKETAKASTASSTTFFFSKENF